MKDEEQTQPKKRSSWAAALSQLPGFPAEEAPRLPEVNGRARDVSAARDEEDDKE